MKRILLFLLLFGSLPAIAQLPNCPSTHHVQQVDTTVSPSVVIDEYDACICITGGSDADHTAVSCISRPLTTVAFNPAPTTCNPANICPMNGQFEGIDFGQGAWAWSGPYQGFSTNNVFFSNGGPASETFAFTANGGSVLIQLQATTSTAGTLTIASDAGESMSQTLATDKVTSVSTGFTKPSKVITITFPGGWDAAFDNIVYQ